MQFRLIFSKVSEYEQIFGADISATTADIVQFVVVKQPPFLNMPPQHNSF